MLKENNFFLSNQDFPDERMVRLLSTLKGRLNILNIFEPLVNNKYKPITTENIKIDIKSEYEIVNFLLKNNDRIDYLYEHITDLFTKNGTSWQKSRLTKK